MRAIAIAGFEDLCLGFRTSLETVVNGHGVTFVASPQGWHFMLKLHQMVPLMPLWMVRARHLGLVCVGCLLSPKGLDCIS